MVTKERTDRAVTDLLSALDKCFEEPVIQPVTWRTAVRPAVVKLIEGIRIAERSSMEGKALHHKDGDPLNNDPDNLEVHTVKCIANGYGVNYGCTCP